MTKLTQSVDYDIEYFEYALKLARRFHTIESDEKQKFKFENPPLYRTAESGLAYFIGMGYTRTKYELFKRGQWSMNYEKVYPPNRKLTEAKNVYTTVPF